MNASAPYEVILRPGANSVWSDLRATWNYRDLILLLVRRDFVSKYRQTILGPAWFVIQPLAMTVVFTVVFSSVAGLSTDGLPPVLFYLCGQLGWNYLALNFNATTNTLVSHAGLFSKVYFPRVIIPLSAVLSNLITFALQLATFAVFFVYFKWVRGVSGLHVDEYLALLPVLVLQIVVLSLGVGLLLSAATAKYRDLSHVAALLLQIWLYATPVIYPLASVPPRWRWIHELNPMSSIVESFRLLLLGTGTVSTRQIVVSVTLTAAMFAAGLKAFGDREKSFVNSV